MELLEIHMSKTENIKIKECTRNTAGGSFTYAMYKGRVVRRPAGKRGRPSYQVVEKFTPSDKDKLIDREVEADSQVARALTAKAA